MICVYAADCTDFSTNGLGLVTPQSCTVTETLNGEYELTLVHPLDENGKWMRLVEGRILRAPVPAAMTPQMSLVDLSTGTLIYKVISPNGRRLNLRTGPGTSYKSLGLYRKNTEVIVLNTSNATWYEVTCPDGKHGYMHTDYLEYVRTESAASSATNQVLEQRELRDQPFRIYRIVPELNKITVYARHIFYDLMDNMIQKYAPTSAESGAVVALTLPTKCLSEHDFTFYSDLESTAEDVVIQNVNPVEAILGDGGVVNKYQAELARDWYDIYLVKRVGSDTNVQIREKKNLLGISYDVDISSAVTRIMPTGQDADGEILYLPELFIDSPNIDSYPSPKWIHLEVSEAKEVTKGDDKKTKAQCYEEMRKAAQAEFDAGCDLPTVTLKVDFINCANTVEYAQYAALQNIYLGDAVSVMAPRIGVAVCMRMTQYTYDCLQKKYTAMTLGTAADTLEGSLISASQLASGSITGTKLAINSVGIGQLQSGSVGALQIQMAAIQTAHIGLAAITNALIADAAITTAKIAQATIEELNATSINAITARIEELAAGNLTTDKLYAALATFVTAQITAANIENANISWADIGTLNAEIAKIAAAQITTANIANANIDWASIANLSAEIAKIAAAQITTANIANANIDWASIQTLEAAVAKIAVAQITTAKLNEAEIDWAEIENLSAAVAKITNASIQDANIDWAQIKDLTTGTAIIEKGINGKLYVADLAVTEANMVSLTVGELIVKGADGSFYSVSVDEDGEIVTTQKQIADADVQDASLSGGKLIENTITARELNVEAIFADEALIGAITAANIKVSDLFASEAFITELNAVDISGNESLRLMVDEAMDAAGEAVAQISLTADEIRSEVKRTYAAASDVQQMQNTLSTLAAQSEDNFTWTVSQINEIMKDVELSQDATQEQLDLIRTYMTFDESGLTIGKSGNPFTFRVVNDRLAFYMNDTEVAYLSNNKLYVTQAEIITRLQVGSFAFEPQTNGNLSIIYTG